jgi:hypothetical protein
MTYPENHGSVNHTLDWVGSRNAAQTSGKVALLGGVALDDLADSTASLKAADPGSSSLVVNTRPGHESEALSAALHHPGCQTATKTSKTTDEEVSLVGGEGELAAVRHD